MLDTSRRRLAFLLGAILTVRTFPSARASGSDKQDSIWKVVKEFFAKGYYRFLQMSDMRGDRIKPGEVIRKLSSLDIDEGVRFEFGGKKIFVNRNHSGAFVAQLGDSKDFYYFESATQVARLVEAELGSKAAAWIY
jgi:hypothetical protein